MKATHSFTSFIQFPTLNSAAGSKINPSSCLHGDTDSIWEKKGSEIETVVLQVKTSDQIGNG